MTDPVRLGGASLGAARSAALPLPLALVFAVVLELLAPPRPRQLAITGSAARGAAHALRRPRTRRRLEAAATLGASSTGCHPPSFASWLGVAAFAANVTGVADVDHQSAARSALSHRRSGSANRRWVDQREGAAKGDGPDPRRGAGGGPGGPGGGGGYGDDPQPTPQDFTGGPPEECSADRGACAGDCLDLLGDAESTCNNLTDDEQRRACHEAAQPRYQLCRERCAGDDKEACRRKCDQKAAREGRKCKKLPEGSPERAKCWQAVEERRGYCYGDCDRK